MTKFIGSSKLCEELLRLMYKIHKKTEPKQTENVKKETLKE